MGLYPEIDATVQKFMEAQPMFFAATAPLAANGHLNLSPKGLDSFRILGPKQVAYLDVTGSGIETVAHLKENGRIVFMFCAFQGLPKIVRLHGHGRVLEPGSPEFASTAAHFPAYASARSIIVADITRVADSCGYGVPLMKFEGTRQQHFAWAEKKGPEGLKTYRKEKNSRSIDGLQGLTD
jgi:Pyridoxamine 5'-phosphate oxidase